MNYYFITGTSSGIGKSLTKNLLKQTRTKVIGISRSNTLSDKYFTHHSIDLSKTEDIINFEFPEIKDATKIFFVNNAGTLGDIAHIGEQSSQNIIDAMHVNFTSVAVLTNSFLKKYSSYSAEKMIVNITSGAAQSPYDGWANYCSSKSAIDMFTQVVDKEQKMKKNGAKIFAIAPGVVDTLMQDCIRETSKENFSQINKFISLKESGKLYTPDAVAKQLISYLHHPETIPSLISRINLHEKA